MSEKRAFTLVEVLIGISILAMILIVAYHILVSGRKGSLKRQESAEHLLAENFLFRSLEIDLRSLIPDAIQTFQGPAGGPMQFAPSSSDAKEILFWRFSGRNLIKVRYIFDEKTSEIRRHEEDAVGNALSVLSFGSGMVTDFSFQDLDGKRETFLVQVSMQGKLKKSTVMRVFAHGFPSRGPAQHWVYNITR